MVGSVGPRLISTLSRILLSLYSSKVRDIIKSFPLDMIGISVPASSVSLGMLLKVNKFKQLTMF